MVQHTEDSRVQFNAVIYFAQNMYHLMFFHQTYYLSIHGIWRQQSILEGRRGIVRSCGIITRVAVAGAALPQGGSCRGDPKYEREEQTHVRTGRQMMRRPDVHDNSHEEDTGTNQKCTGRQSFHASIVVLVPSNKEEKGRNTSHQNGSVIQLVAAILALRWTVPQSEGHRHGKEDTQEGPQKGENTGDSWRSVHGCCNSGGSVVFFDSRVYPRGSEEEIND